MENAATMAEPGTLFFGRKQVQVASPKNNSPREPPRFQATNAVVSASREQLDLQTFFTAGMTQLPSRIEGSVSLGQ